MSVGPVAGTSMHIVASGVPPPGSAVVSPGVSDMRDSGGWQKAFPLAPLAGAPPAPQPVLRPPLRVARCPMPFDDIPPLPGFRADAHVAVRVTDWTVSMNNQQEAAMPAPEDDDPGSRPGTSLRGSEKSKSVFVSLMGVL